MFHLSGNCSFALFCPVYFLKPSGRLTFLRKSSVRFIYPFLLGLHIKIYNFINISDYYYYCCLACASLSWSLFTSQFSLFFVTFLISNPVCSSAATISLSLRSECSLTRLFSLAQSLCASIGHPLRDLINCSLLTVANPRRLLSGRGTICRRQLYYGRTLPVIVCVFYQYLPPLRWLLMTIDASFTHAPWREKANYC